jgi:hypothetical protein
MIREHTNQFIYFGKIPEDTIVAFYTLLDEFSACPTDKDTFSKARQLLAWAEKQDNTHVKILAAASVEQAMAALRSEHNVHHFVSTMFDIDRAAHRLFTETIENMPPLDAFHASAAALNSTNEDIIGRHAKHILLELEQSGIVSARGLDNDEPVQLEKIHRPAWLNYHM